MSVAVWTHTWIPCHGMNDTADKYRYKYKYKYSSHVCRRWTHMDSMSWNEWYSRQIQIQIQLTCLSQFEHTWIPCHGMNDIADKYRYKYKYKYKYSSHVCRRWTHLEFMIQQTNTDLRLYPNKYNYTSKYYNIVDEDTQERRQNPPTHPTGILGNQPRRVVIRWSSVYHVSMWLDVDI